MASKFSGKEKFTSPINVLDGVCRFSSNGWVEGKVVEVKVKRSSRSKGMESTYVMMFDDDRKRLEKNFETTAELKDFCKQRKIGEEALTMTNYQDLRVVGSHLLTKWTLELNQLAGGDEPPQWLVDLEPAFVRKCLVKKIHKPLMQFELVYTCGYVRYVPISSMLELLNTHHVYCTSENSKIRLSVQKAEVEWNIRHAPSELTSSQKATDRVDGSCNSTAPERTSGWRKQKEVCRTTVQADDLPSSDDVVLHEPDKNNNDVHAIEEKVQDAVAPQEPSVNIHDVATDLPSSDDVALDDPDKNNNDVHAIEEKIQDAVAPQEP